MIYTFLPYGVLGSLVTVGYIMDYRFGFVKLSELVVSIMFSETHVGQDDECICRSQDIKRISTLIMGLDIGALVSEASHRLLRNHMNEHCCVPIIDAREMEREMELRHILRTGQINRGMYDEYCFGKGNEKVVSVRCFSRSKDCKITIECLYILCMIFHLKA